MHIRKLEIHGFKSFPDRVVFHFSDGISGIVGPNGCGKSNVLDAMKWCLGEQSARELRGAAMEDVVFSGAQGRAPMSMAQVIMTFGAGDRPFAGEWARFDELQVSRRILRGGGSEYRIHQHRVRLKDVQDLFLDTGAGNRFYSFIEQGRIGAVIAASAQERRGLLEEAAGTSRYKARRAETLVRLDTTLANLERSVHVVEELEQRLEQLAKQVDKAARFRRLRAIVAQTSLLLALARFGALRQDRTALNGEARAASGERERRERQLALATVELAREKEQAEVVDAVVGGLRDQLAELEATRRELESARQYQERERADLLERARRLGTELDQAGARTARLEQERAAAERAVEERIATIEAARATAAEQEERCAAAGRSLGVARELRDRRRRAVADVRAAAERAGARAETLAQQQARIREDLEGRDKDLGAARAEGERLVQARLAAEAQREAARVRNTQLKETLATAQATWTDAEGEVRVALERRLEADQAVVALERDLAQVRGRRDSLRELAGRHEGLADASRRVLQALPDAFALAEELEVPEALVEPLALALGERVDVVVLPGAGELHRAVEIAGQGSAWLLLADCEAALPSEGLAAEVGGTERARRALGQILGRCAIAADLSEALTRATAGWTAVFGGLRATPGGLVRLGRGGPAAACVLSRRRTLQEAEQRCAALEAEATVAREAQRGAQEAELARRAGRDRARQARDAQEQEVRRSEVEATGLEHRVRAGREAEERQQRLLAELAARAGQQRGRVEVVAAELTEARALAAAAQAQAQQATEELASAEREAGRLGGEHAALQAALQRLREELAAAEARLQGARAATAAAARALEQAHEAVERARGEATLVAARQAELGEQEHATEESITEVAGRQAGVAEKLAHERKNLVEARRRVERAEAAVGDAREARDRASVAVQALELKLGEVRARIDALKRQGEEELGISLPAQLDRLEKNGQLVVPHGLSDDERLPLDLKRLPEVEDVVLVPRQLEDPALLAEWADHLDKSRKRLEGLGDVNLTAVEEYLEVQARYEELMGQRKDLEASVQEIRAALARINRTCRERFREAFDQVNVHFGELYQRLSAGGKASLVLTDEEDLLETGVDIVAQPPGKRLRSLSLLSGGEKALVALAVVFALFRVRPSPFCILDEVDAPLDEGNGARFNELLRDMSRHSQFIIISHNKKTIECADTLYGVTMQEPGISKLVTVQLT